MSSSSVRTALENSQHGMLCSSTSSQRETLIRRVSTNLTSVLQSKIVRSAYSAGDCTQLHSPATLTRARLRSYGYAHRICSQAMLTGYAHRLRSPATRTWPRSQGATLYGVRLRAARNKAPKARKELNARKELKAWNAQSRLDFRNSKVPSTGTWRDLQIA